MLTHFSHVQLFVALWTITICQAPLCVLTTHNDINQISLSEKMVMLNSFQLLWPLCTRALWTWSLVWGEGGWLILWRKVTSSTSFVEPPVYVRAARVLCICVSIRGLGYLLIQSVTQSCPSLCHLMDCSTPGLPVHHQLPEFTQTHVHWVSDAIQPSYPLSSPSPPTFNLSQHQGLFSWISS